MKFLQCCILFICCNCVQVSAQKINAQQVPGSVMQAFQSKFPNATKAKWEMESADVYEVNFKMLRKKKSACFDRQGKWLETETEIKISELPKVVGQTLATQFPGYKIEEADRSETFDRGVIYEVVVEKREVSYEVQLSTLGEVL